MWQSIASGLLGKAAYEGGSATAPLGLALHFFIAFVMALVYVLAARRLPCSCRSGPCSWASSTASCSTW